MTGAHRDTDTAALRAAVSSLYLDAGKPPLREVAVPIGVSHTTVGVALRAPEQVGLQRFLSIVTAIGGDRRHFQGLWTAAHGGVLHAARADRRHAPTRPRPPRDAEAARALHAEVNALYHESGDRTYRDVAARADTSYTTIATFLADPTRVSLHLLLRLVQVLGGDPAHFQEMWTAARERADPTEDAPAGTAPEVPDTDRVLFHVLRLSHPHATSASVAAVAREATDLAQLTQLACSTAAEMGAVAASRYLPGGLDAYLTAAASLATTLAAVTAEMEDRLAHATELLATLDSQRHV